MPLLASWLGSLLASLVSFFAVFLTKRIAIVVAVITAAAVLTGAFVAALQGLMIGIASATPTWLALGWGWLGPDNIDECAAAIISAHILRWVYYWNIKIIQYKLV